MSNKNPLVPLSHGYSPRELKILELAVTYNSTEKLKFRQHYSRTVLPRAYGAVVTLIKARLEKLGLISFTTDIWSSSSYNFISLTAHGINEEWERVKYVLAVRELSGSHTGVQINLAVKRILEEWDIKEEQCHVFLRDGAANMKKAFEGEFDHADCGAHKLNLAVKGTIRSARPLIEELGQMQKKCGTLFSLQLGQRQTS